MRHTICYFMATIVYDGQLIIDGEVKRLKMNNFSFKLCVANDVAIRTFQRLNINTVTLP